MATSVDEKRTDIYLPVWDLLNVATIHNSSFDSSDLLSDDKLSRLRYLADEHELGLAYNESESVRAIAGATLAFQVVQAFNQTITSEGEQAKLNVQFGAYASFLAFFGLAGLLDLNDGAFRGVPDYASSMTFELFANDSVPVAAGGIAPSLSSQATFPDLKDLNVRFLFHNGTTSNMSEPVAFPLFGQTEVSLPWTDFVNGMNRFAIGDEADWCQACGNKTGVCAPLTASPSSPSGAQGSGDTGVSKVVAGAIGAMVTLVIILGVEALIFLVAGLRVVKKQRRASTERANGKASGWPNGQVKGM